MRNVTVEFCEMRKGWVVKIDGRFHDWFHRQLAAEFYASRFGFVSKWRPSL